MWHGVGSRPREPWGWPRGRAGEPRSESSRVARPHLRTEMARQHPAGLEGGVTLALGSAERPATHRLHCGANPIVLFQGLQGPPSGLTHLPILHKEDMQWVQSAEVEDVNVVLYGHLGTRPPNWSLMPNTTSEVPGKACSLCFPLSRFPHIPSLVTTFPRIRPPLPDLQLRAQLHRHTPLPTKARPPDPSLLPCS